jgi:RES domain-containing protein
MSKRYVGRFNTSSIGAVYTSREPATAIEELRRRAARDGISLTDMHPRSIFVLHVSLHAVLDLTLPNALAMWGLNADDLGRDDFSRCQEVATVAAQHGAEAIRWASATGRGQSLALWVERLLPGSSVEIEHEFSVSREKLAELDAGIDARILMPELQSFPLLDLGD